MVEIYYLRPMSLIPLSHRSILRIEGKDRRSFLQGLVTNDVLKLSPENPLYACLLNPQGKILFDFFLYEQGNTILLDVWEEWQDELLKKLHMYRLRAEVKVVILPDLRVYAALEPTEVKGEVMLRTADPRHPAMGERLIAAAALNEARGNPRDYEHHRIALGIPESPDFIEGRSFTAEYAIADLHGVSYNKGCYVGQEVVARSKTRGVLRKMIHKVQAEITLPESGTVVSFQGHEIGQLRSVQGNIGLAMLRLDEVKQSVKEKLPLMAGDVELTAALPDWLTIPQDNSQTG